MKKPSSNTYTAEFFCICLLALVLPLFETVKHIVCLLYLFLFIQRTINFREKFTHHPAGKYFLLLIGGSTLSSIGAYINGYEIHKLHDIIRYTLIGWMLLHTPLSRRQVYIILFLFLVATIVGSLHAYYLLAQGVNRTFELYSVGHINHSAIYIAHIIGASLPLLLLYQKKSYLVVIVLVNLFLCYTLIDTDSRATFLTLGMFVLTLTITCILKKIKLGYIMVAATAVFMLYCVYQPPAVVKKFIIMHNNYGEKLSPRERIWNTAIYAWKKEPVFGVGFGNYRVITLEKMQQWYPDIDVSDKEKFYYFPHTHNRYLNTLAEGGLIGLLTLLLFAGGILSVFLRQLRHSLKSTHDTIFYLVGFNTLLAIFFAGLFNTTLHHEHGMLAMMLMALSLQQITQKTEAI